GRRRAWIDQTVGGWVDLGHFGAGSGLPSAQEPGARSSFPAGLTAFCSLAA
uniref:Uncharacterized protein n=1 Tax=Aegilops tauschii subsp. strangulata TaxID=200361 RepID=A0A453T6P7_AEGTS